MSEEKKDLPAGKAGIIKKYSNDDLTVVWKPTVCIHSKKCWKELIQVFNPQNRPWIHMEGASTERITKQVDACPSGALTHYSKNQNKIENMESETKVTVMENGPLLVNGTIEITKADGTTENKTKTTAFCRCGASASKPYCDGEHRKIDFKG